MAFTPSGRVFVTERDSGRVLEFLPGGEIREVHRFEVDPAGEGGLLGLAASPAEDGLLYAYFTSAEDNRVVRFRPGSEPEPIITGIPKASLHDGGRIAFGPDGMLYVATGDATVPELGPGPALPCREDPQAPFRSCEERAAHGIQAPPDDVGREVAALDGQEPRGRGARSPSGRLSRLPVALVALGLLAGACRGTEQRAAQPTPSPTPASPTPSPTASPAETPIAEESPTLPEVFGTIQIGFVPGGKGAVLPTPPIGDITLVLEPAKGGLEERHEVLDPDPGWREVEGKYSLSIYDFEIALEPGRYVVTGVEVDAQEMAPEPFILIGSRMRISVPRKGCVYVGRITLNYYRLPAGSLKKQSEAAGALVPAGQEFYTQYFETGGLLGESAAVDLAPKHKQPVGAGGCQRDLAKL